MGPGNVKHRLLIEHLPDAYAYHQIITDSAGEPVDYIILDVNRAFEKMFNLSQEMVVGKRITEVFPKIKKTSFDWFGSFGRVAMTGETLRFEHFYKAKDNWYELTAYSDEPGYFALLFRNITENKNAEEALRASEAKYNGVFDSARDALLIFNKDDIVVDVNPAACRIYDYSREEFVGLAGHDIVHPSYHHLLAKFMDDVQQKGYFHTESMDVRRDGSAFHVEVTGSPVLYKGEEHLLAIVRDITPRKDAEQQLADHARELEGLYRQLETLLRETHHRVKNNFAVIISLLDMQRRQMGEEKSAAILRDLNNRIHAMALVHEKLYSSKDFSRISMQQYLQSLITHLNFLLLPQKSIQYLVEAEGVELAMETAVPCALIMQELLTNAVKHAFPTDFPPGGATASPTIKVMLTQDKNTCQLEVSDNGIGLPPGLELSKVRTIGLRLVRLLGEHQLGGRVEMQGNEQNGGTKFKLNFTVEQSSGG